VPGTVQVGDIVCRFNLDATTYVLRKTPVTDTRLDATMLNFFFESKLKAKENDIWSGAGTKLLNYLDTSKVEHCDFISEYFADLPSKWEEFWKGNGIFLPNSVEDFVPSIFALH
jgi:hypothetical protein